MTDDVAAAVRELPASERRILSVLKKNAPGAYTLSALTAAAGFSNDNETFSAASWLQKKGLVEITETSSKRVAVGPEGQRFLRDGFPERAVYNQTVKSPGGLSLSRLRELVGEGTASIALAWWKKKGLGSIDKRGNDTVLVANPKISVSTDEQLLQEIDVKTRHSHDGRLSVREEEARRLDAAAYELLRSRPGVLEIKEVKQREVSLTPRARAIPMDSISLEEGLAELTPELIKSGAWKGKELRPYDLGTPVPRTLSGKPHPLVQIIEEIRDIFVQLGFQEIEEDFVQSAFWNMDALFIPQDHPAREMQDTFYLQTPSALPVEDELIERIGRVHKDGGDTGSRGWGQTLDPAESRRALLRTHTTVGTIRYLAAHPTPPLRVFSIGRVFRKETMDATHLPEFHQIEGIATEEGADFPMLLGILKEFYRRLGFEQLRWRPAYFPYTEPSMEVEVWTGKKWMELGGCGIFRPEVTEPFGVKTPVLAWGLGLERLAMLRLGLSDIRDLYVSDLEWLRSQPLL